MAKGYPDFYGCSIFPRHGPTYQDEQFNFTVEDGDTETIHDLGGKGRIIGGRLYLHAFSNWAKVWPQVYIDGVQLTANASIDGLWRLYGQNDSEIPLSLTYYCGNDGQAVLYYVKDFAWNESFVVTLQNLHDVDLLVNSYLNYTLLA